MSKKLNHAKKMEHLSAHETFFEKLPLTMIDWERHLPYIAQANSPLTRFDKILLTILNPGLLLAPIMTQEAVLSSQIELLHPFLDGNGRVGRILIPLFLYEKKMTFHPSFYISGFFDLERNAHCDHLENILKNNAWDNWIEFFLQTIIFQAQSSLAKQVIKLYEETKVDIAEKTRPYFVIRILDFIFSQPIFKGTAFVNAVSISKATASRLLKVLVEGGILTSVREKMGHAGQTYCFEKLLKILTLNSSGWCKLR